MRLSLRTFPAAVALAATLAPALPASALPTSLSTVIGCSIRTIARTPTNHKIVNGYAVDVADTLSQPLSAGTSLEYVVQFSDGTSQATRASLPQTLSPGASEVIGDGDIASPSPSSCIAGIPKTVTFPSGPRTITPPKTGKALI